MAPGVDLYDFAMVVRQNAVAQETRQTADDLMSFVRSGLVVRSMGINRDPVNGYDYARAGGIAINMTMKTKNPENPMLNIHETAYSELGLSQASSWDEFLVWTDRIWLE